MPEKLSKEVMDAIAGLDKAPRPALAPKVHVAPPAQPKKAIPVTAPVLTVRAPPPIAIDPSLVARRRAIQEDKRKAEQQEEDRSVSAGPISAIVEYIANPTQEKIREVTYVDAQQAHLFPLLDTVNMLQLYVLSIAEYRMNPKLYSETHKDVYPPQPNVINHLLYRTAQWQRSLKGKNLEKLQDIAQSEVEGKSQDEGGGGGGNPFND